MWNKEGEIVRFNVVSKRMLEQGKHGVLITLELSEFR